MAKVGKSSKEEDESLVQALARTHHEVGVALEREAGMSRSRLHVLASLRGGEELTQSTLQQLLGVDGAAITRQVKQMEVDGLVQRRSHPDDHRFTLVCLTAQGKRVADAVVRKRDSFEARLTAAASARDVTSMTRTMEKLRDAARAKR